MRESVSAPVLWISRMLFRAVEANSCFRLMFASTAFLNGVSGFGFPKTTPRCLATARRAVVRSELNRSRRAGMAGLPVGGRHRNGTRNRLAGPLCRWPRRRGLPATNRARSGIRSVSPPFCCRILARCGFNQLVDDDFQLLRRYATERCEAAFAELARRHAGLVYAAALRRLHGRRDLAEEVAQQVLVDLARKAGAFAPGIVLGGWLHRHTGFLAATALRQETRRLNREREAHSRNETSQPGASLIDQLSPELDAALEALPATDRDALVLRFLQQRDFRGVGAALGISEDAAQKRVARAMAKLRVVFARRGYAVSALALSAVLAETAAVTAPATLAAATLSAIAGATGAATLASSAATGKMTIPALLMNKAKIALLAVLAAGLATPVVRHYRQVDQLTAENQALRQEMEKSRVEREARDAASEQLRGSLERAQTDLDELVRLRGDVTRLRLALAAATNQAPNGARARANDPAAADPGQPRLTTFSGTARASLERGQTLVMGGWPTAPGKRTLMLLTPEANATGSLSTVLVGSLYVQVPEAMLAETGWEPFRSLTPEASASGVLAAEQTKAFMEALEKRDGVDILSAPRVTTLSGREACISIGNANGPGLTATLLPVLSADGRTVDLSVSNSLSSVEGSLGGKSWTGPDGEAPKTNSAAPGPLPQPRSSP